MFFAHFNHMTEAKIERSVSEIKVTSKKIIKIL